MSLPNGSASANARTIHCPASLVLPRVHRASPWSNRGHGIHGYVRAVLSGVDVAQALAAVDEGDRETCRMTDWHKLCGDITDIRSEVAYAVDVRARTARLLGVNIGRDYARAAVTAGAPLGEWEIPGSLDIEGASTLTQRPTVIDLKSGFLDVDDADENAQGLFFGAVKHLMTGASEVDFRIGKLKPSGGIWLDCATYDAWAIDDYLDTVEAALVASKEARLVYLAGGVPDVTEGEHCRYCHAADACPAKTRLARAMVPELEAIEAAIAEMTPEAAGKAYVIAHDRAAPVLERVLDALKDRARQTPIPLPDGKVLREAPYEKDQQVFSAAIELARKLGATEEQIRGCYRPTVIRPVKACAPPKPKGRGRRAEAGA